MFLLFSQYMIREWLQDIEELAECTYSFLKANNPASRAEKFNSMVLLVYYNKKDEGKSVMQLPFHRDQAWSRKGWEAASL